MSTWWRIDLLELWRIGNAVAEERSALATAKLEVKAQRPDRRWTLDVERVVA